MNRSVRARRLFPLLMLMIAALAAPASAQNGKARNGKPTAADLALKRNPANVIPPKFPDLPRLDPRQLLHGVQHDPQLR